MKPPQSNTNLKDIHDDIQRITVVSMIAPRSNFYIESLVSRKKIETWNSSLQHTIFTRYKIKFKQFSRKTLFCLEFYLLAAGVRNCQNGSENLSISFTLSHDLSHSILTEVGK